MFRYFWLFILFTSCLALRAETEQAWKPAPSPLMSKFSASVNAREISPIDFYPRPAMVRKDSVVKNLMGLWDYSISELNAKPAGYDGKIRVPFPVESPLSGVGKKVGPAQKLCYHLECEIEWGTEWIKSTDSRLILNFDGVNHDAVVYVNGKEVGSHHGGDDAFSFDVTDLVAGQKKHLMQIEVVVTPAAARGPLAATGICKPVWIEGRPASHIESLRFAPDLDAGLVRVAIEGEIQANDIVEVIACDRGTEVARATCLPGEIGKTLQLAIKDPKAWTPSAPFMYEYTASVKRGDRYVDSVRGFFAMRKIALGNNEKNIPITFLNNKPLFVAGVIDASWWPDGGSTAPTADSIRCEIEKMKQLGFNSVRKMSRTGEATWYRWCDRFGLMVWQELPFGDAKTMAAEYPRIIRELDIHPSIVAWVLPKEIPEEDAAEWVKAIRLIDPARLVVGGPAGDIREFSLMTLDLTQASKQAGLLSPLGDVQSPVYGHAWSTNAASSLMNPSVYFEALAGKMAEQRAANGFSGFFYKQFADAGDDHSGLLTGDREVIKLDLEQLAKKNAPSWAVPRIRMVVPTSRVDSKESNLGEWRYTDTRPPDEWLKPLFDASNWSKGIGAFGAKNPESLTIRTEWTGTDLWARRAFILDSAKLNEPWIVWRRSADLEVFLNGERVLDKHGIPLPGYGSVRCKNGIEGANLIEAHAHGEAGKGFMDVGLFDLLQVECAPDLTAPPPIQKPPRL